MKIWEIEEGKEFRVIDHSVYDERCTFKLINKKIYVKVVDDPFIRWDMSYNAIEGMDFEYLPEKKYYLVMKPEMEHECGSDLLNYDTIEKKFWFSNDYETEIIKTTFTEAEIKQLIPPLYLKICDKIEVEDE